MNFTKTLFLVLALTQLPALAFSAHHTSGQPPAQDSNASQQNNLSGEVTAGVIFINNANNLNPNGSSATLKDLDSSPDRELSTIGVLLPELNYRFGSNQQYGWFFNTRPPIDEAGNFAIISGFSYDHPSLAFIEAGGFWVPFREAWKNPYLEGEPRSETDVSTWGGFLSLKRLLGSNVRFRLAYLNEDVADDDLTQLFPSLARDGAIYGCSLSYDLNIADNFSLQPALLLRKGEYDGDASSFWKVKVEISGMYRIGPIFLRPQVFYSYREHDETDPVFDKTLEEHGYGLGMMANYGGLFGMRELSLRLMAGYSQGDASIEFYDTESLFGGLGLAYRF